MNSVLSPFKMDLLLIYSSLISVAIFLPLSYIVVKNEMLTKPVRLFLVGGAGWSIASLVSFLPFLILISSSNQEAYREAMDQSVYAVFGILVLFALISEVIRFRAAVLMEYFENKYSYGFIFGAGWTVSEYITRFIGFFEEPSFINSVILFIILLVINLNLSVVMIRSVENTRYVIFAVFMRVITELALWGGLSQGDLNDNFLSIALTVLFMISMVVLSFIARKYPLED